LDPEKAMTVRKFPKPTKPAEVRSFYGLVNFCRDFLPGICTPDRFDKEKCEVQLDDKAIEEIKELVARSVELTVFDPKKPVTLQTDASDLGLGVVLLQPNENSVMAQHQGSWTNMRTITPLILAIVCALKTFRHYVEGMPINIETELT
jgi:hypothetical protein